MRVTALDASYRGLGCARLSGAGPLAGTTTLDTLAGGTVPVGTTGVDIYAVSGDVYFTNDATTADDNDFPLVGILSVRNGSNQIEQTLSRLRFYCAGAYDIRVAFWG